MEFLTRQILILGIVLSMGIAGEGVFSLEEWFHRYSEMNNHETTRPIYLIHSKNVLDAKIMNVSIAS